jgi:transcriptional accessory protein Tex/SPT6
MVEMYQIDAIAIGNGTASRETETFVKNLRYNREIRVYVVMKMALRFILHPRLPVRNFPSTMLLCAEQFLLAGG